MASGTYTLVIELERPVAIDIGALGRRELDAGWFAYSGTAFGPGGFARIDRHRAVEEGRNETRHWHVDYLLGDAQSAISAVYRTPGIDAECRFSNAIPGRSIEGFGASDCDCDSHLVYNTTRQDLQSALQELHETCVREEP
ncbi:MAG: Uri superfamily endonuclease [Halobacteriales archaeon]|jgi:Uri superfamily endonuclease